MQAIVPEDVGFSSARLGRIDACMQSLVDRGTIAGAVTLVARHGKPAHFAACGLMDVEAKRAMRPDSIFRIFSMTKPVTAVAVMMLYEEGRLLLDDPVSSFIPEFAETKAFVRETADGVELADLERPIAVRHLLTHTSGLPYPWPTGTAVEVAYAQDEILRWDEPLESKVRRIARLPLAHQPGSAWTYGVSFDVLGRLVEVVSGQAFDVFLKERIFDPLEMVDTGFYVPPQNLGRLAALYTPGARGDLQRVETSVLGMLPDFAEPRPYLSGGVGLASTASDYARFCQMLLGGGKLGGTRLLGRKTVELMTADHLARDRIPFPPPSFESLLAGHSMSLVGGTLVDVARFGIPGSAGAYMWVGVASTGFWIDPQEDLFGIILTQLWPPSFRPYHTFEALTYQALVD